MKIFRLLTMVILFSILFQPIFGEKRIKARTMEELSDISSPSYVPNPYPKNRSEIIEDLKYAIKKIFTNKEGNYFGGKTPIVKELLLNLLEKKSSYQIDDIIKVENHCSELADDYTWLIIVRNKQEVAVRIVLNANGLFNTASATQRSKEFFIKKYPGQKRGPHYLVNEEDVISALSSLPGKQIAQGEIKKVKRIVFRSRISTLLAPMWEITLSDGSYLYYSEITDSVYTVERKMTWKKKGERGERENLWKLVTPSEEFVCDTIEDEILVFKKLARGNVK